MKCLKEATDVVNKYGIDHCTIQMEDEDYIKENPGKDCGG
jgi:PP-loop superfamily ATP-utilizing enzyme